MKTQPRLLGKYPAAPGLQFACEALSLDPAPVLRHAGLPSDFLEIDPRPVSAAQFFDIWEAVAALCPQPDLPLMLAQAVAKAGLDSAEYAFSCSPDLRTGFERKALFKPLLLPMELRLSETDAGFSVTFRSLLPERALPPLMGWTQLAYFVQAARASTGQALVPLRVGAAQDWTGWPARDEFFGQKVEIGDDYTLVFTAADAALPLVSRDDALWRQTQQYLALCAAHLPERSGMPARVQHALAEGLPGGRVHADQVARHLTLSLRSLQRALTAQGTRFSAVLAETRQALARSYLENTDLSVEEIALLLAFRDASAFFRAFKGWTGTTPGAFRGG